MSRNLAKRRPREQCCSCDGKGYIMVPGKHDWDCDQVYEEACQECDGRGRHGDWHLPTTLAAKYVWALQQADLARTSFGRSGPDRRSHYRLEFARAMALARALRLAIRDGAAVSRHWIGMDCITLADGREADAVQHYGLQVDPRPHWRAETQAIVRLLKQNLDAGNVVRVKVEEPHYRLEAEMSALHLVENPQGEITYARLYQPGTGQHLELTRLTSCGFARVQEGGRLYNYYGFGVVEGQSEPYVSKRLTLIVPAEELPVREEPSIEEIMERVHRELPRHERRMWEIRTAKAQQSAASEG